MDHAGFLGGLALLLLAAPGNASAAMACDPVTESDIRQAIQSVNETPPGTVASVEAIDKLFHRWLERCEKRIAVGPATIKDIASLLERWEFRQPATVMLYEIGPAARIARAEVAASLRDERRIQKEQARTSYVYAGNAKTQMEDLQCLDAMLRTGKKARTCKHIDLYLADTPPR